MDYQDQGFDSTGSSTPPIPQGVSHDPSRDHHSKPRSPWRLLWWFLFLSSMLGNVILFVGLVAVGTMALGVQDAPFHERVIQGKGHGDKVVVVSIEGLIDSRQSEKLRGQLNMAQQDSSVRGVIVKINSPGGTISASDQIFARLKTYRKYNAKKPVVAFMQGMAASGGYYAAVACEEIMAEPTVITGSIGVIFSNLVVQDLFENKLGILPVVVKSGPKKDWPSSYRAPSEEELSYIDERLITPAYDRFLEIVAEGRQGILTPDEIRPLADGGIYSAKAAKDEKLVDHIGYLEDAVELVRSKAGLSAVKVVEYEEVFSLASLLGVKSHLPGVKLDRGLIHELTTPELLYMWKGY
ncbi:MAG: signal peptide peptidase SppA [Planctomycetes bacterium]|nr:signal peptide peptidase SppA [Planctomycetota bacterium]